MNSYAFGDSVVLSQTFTVAGTPTAPSTVTLTVMSPSGVKTTTTGGSLTSPSTGVYSKVVVADEVGLWQYRWEGTGTAAGTDEGGFQVLPSVFAP